MLTAKRIRDAKPGQKPLWDSRVKGLGLRVSSKGTKSFVLVYRINGKQRWAKLGRFGEMSLEDARQLAGKWKVMIGEGVDPVEQRQERKEAPTMGEAVSRFFDEEVPKRIALGRMTESTAYEYRYQWRHYLAPKLEKMKVAEIERHHIERAVAKIAPTTRNRVLALLSRMFTLFEVCDLRPQNSSPVRGIERAREEPRDRVLTAEELAAFASALREHDGDDAAKAAISVAAISGLRIGEVLAMRWENLDTATGRLILPETKTGRRQHTLPAPALDVVERLPRSCDWIFSARRSAPCTYRYVRVVFQEICKAAGIKGVRLHDLRRTVMTRAAASGVPAPILQQLLGHKTIEVALRYVREVGDPVTEARERVGAEIAEAMNLQ